MFLHHLIHQIYHNLSARNLNDSFEDAINFGGIEFIQNDLALYIIFLILTFFGVIFGFLGKN